MNNIPVPEKNKKLAQLIAMVHVPSNSIFQNTVYLDKMKIKTYSVAELMILNKARKMLLQLFREVLEENQLSFLD